MADICGWAGTLLYIDLESGSIEKEKHFGIRCLRTLRSLEKKVQCKNRRSRKMFE